MILDLAFSGGCFGFEFSYYTESTVYTAAICHTKQTLHRGYQKCPLTSHETFSNCYTASEIKNSMHTTVPIKKAERIQFRKV